MLVFLGVGLVALGMAAFNRTGRKVLAWLAVTLVILGFVVVAYIPHPQPPLFIPAVGELYHREWWRGLVLSPKEWGAVAMFALISWLTQSGRLLWQKITSGQKLVAIGRHPKWDIGWPHDAPDPVHDRARWVEVHRLLAAPDKPVHH